LYLYFLNFVVILLYPENDNSNIIPKLLKINFGASLEIKISCYASAGRARWFFKKKKKDEHAIRLTETGNELIIKQHDYDTAGYYYCFGLDYYTKKEFIAVAVVLIYGEFMTIVTILLTVILSFHSREGYSSHHLCRYVMIILSFCHPVFHRS